MLTDRQTDKQTDRRTLLVPKVSIATEKNAIVELNTKNLMTEIQEPFENDIEEVKIDLNKLQLL